LKLGDKLKLGNWGKCELYPYVKPQKFVFHHLGTSQVFIPGFTNSLDCFTSISGGKISEFPFYIMENDKKIQHTKVKKKTTLFNIEKRNTLKNSTLPKLVLY
jgi:hypothetical protein